MFVDIDYVEVYGMGMLIGDLIEVEVLVNVLSEGCFVL